MSDKSIIPVVPRRTSVAAYKSNHILLPSVKNPFESAGSSSRYLLGDMNILQAPSTPMPAPSLIPLSPAWDPSSRTPNPGATYREPIVQNNFLSSLTQYIKAYNPWMDSPLLSGKRIRVLFADTIPGHQNAGWRHGELEGRTALWVGAENGEAQLQQADGKRLNVLERYVRPLHPHAKGALVVVIKEGLITGKELYVLKYDEKKCTVRPGNESATPYNRTDIDTDSLVVVAPLNKLR